MFFSLGEIIARYNVDLNFNMRDLAVSINAWQTNMTDVGFQASFHDQFIFDGRKERLRCRVRDNCGYFTAHAGRTGSVLDPWDFLWLHHVWFFDQAV